MTGEVSAPAVNNFGLSSTQAKGVQRCLAVAFGYNGAIDGIAGDGTRAAFKRFGDKAVSLC
ncbi:peptidoglycan-binding domain-containing protein [Streptomyces sp. enrichment culture]|uniref:peptidoglycan-binding domain-containing protein n=1 Tax=Streptomyces sp. enrichment culture TaxID=1795815 RepID=UPI003F566FBD